MNRNAAIESLQCLIQTEFSFKYSFGNFYVYIINQISPLFSAFLPHLSIFRFIKTLIELFPRPNKASTTRIDL